MSCVLRSFGARCVLLDILVFLQDWNLAALHPAALASALLKVSLFAFLAYERCQSLMKSIISIQTLSVQP